MKILVLLLMLFPAIGNTTLFQSERQEQKAVQTMPLPVFDNPASYRELGIVSVYPTDGKVFVALFEDYRHIKFMSDRYWNNRKKLIPSIGSSLCQKTKKGLGRQGVLMGRVVLMKYTSAFPNGDVKIFKKNC